MIALAFIVIVFGVCAIAPLLVSSVPANNWASLPPFFFYVADAKITGQVAYTYLAKRKKDDRDENEGNSDDDDADCDQDGVRRSGSESKWQYKNPLPR
jgi:hypothetical protein